MPEGIEQAVRALEIPAIMGTIEHVAKVLSKASSKQKEIYKKKGVFIVVESDSGDHAFCIDPHQEYQITEDDFYRGVAISRGETARIMDVVKEVEMRREQVRQEIAEIKDLQAKVQEEKAVNLLNKINNQPKQGMTDFTFMLTKSDYESLLSRARRNKNVFVSVCEIIKSRLMSSMFISSPYDRATLTFFTDKKLNAGYETPIPKAVKGHHTLLMVAVRARAIINKKLPYTTVQIKVLERLGANDIREEEDHANLIFSSLATKKPVRGNAPSVNVNFRVKDSHCKLNTPMLIAANMEQQSVNINFSTNAPVAHIRPIFKNIGNYRVIDELEATLQGALSHEGKKFFSCYNIRLPKEETTHGSAHEVLRSLMTTFQTDNLKHIMEDILSFYESMRESTTHQDYVIHDVGAKYMKNAGLMLQFLAGACRDRSNNGRSDFFKLMENDWALINRLNLVTGFEQKQFE
jgi:hypothetical protein